MQRTSKLLSLLLALVVVLAACGTGTDDGDGDAGSDTTAATDGGTETTETTEAPDEPDEPEEPEGDVDSITFITQVAETEEAAIEKLAALYEEQTGIAVDVQFTAAADAQLLLASQVESGNVEVDVAAIPNDQLFPYVSQGLVADLTQYESEIDPAVPQVLLDGGRADGVLRFMPYRGNVQLTYYRTDIFESLGLEPPATFDDWRAACEAMLADAGAPRCLYKGAYDPNAVNPTQTWEWIASFGGDPTVLNDEGSVAAYEFLAGMQADGLFHPDSAAAKWDTSNESFARGDVNLMQNWPFGIQVIRDLGVTDFAVYSGAAGPAGEFHVVGGEVLAIVEGTPKQEAAWDFIQFLTGAEAQGILAVDNAWPTFREDALASVPDERLPEFEAMAQAMEGGIVRPNEPWIPDLYDLMIQAYDRIVISGEDAQATLDELAGQLAELQG